MFRVLSLTVVAAGTVACCWYERLRPQQQQVADRAAARYARSLFGRHLDELNAAQLLRVLEAARHFLTPVLGGREEPRW